MCFPIPGSHPDPVNAPGQRPVGSQLLHRHHRTVHHVGAGGLGERGNRPISVHSLDADAKPDWPLIGHFRLAVDHPLHPRRCRARRRRRSQIPRTSRGRCSLRRGLVLDASADSRSGVRRGSRLRPLSCSRRPAEGSPAQLRATDQNDPAAGPCVRSRGRQPHTTMWPGRFLKRTV
jgi:hypothetical protein